MASWRSVAVLVFTLLACTLASAQTPNTTPMFTATPLKGLNRIPVLQMPTANSAPCYGLRYGVQTELSPTPAEMNSLALAGFRIQAPDSAKSGAIAVISQFIKVSDGMFMYTEKLCMDILRLEVMQQTTATLAHNGERIAASVPLWGTEIVVAGQNKEQFLSSRSGSLTKMFELLAEEWKKQNGGK